MLSRFMKLHKNQKGITGLETAIILIAFVVVASVFAYTVLSAGLFSTQKSQEAVYNGLSEAESTMQLSGGVTAFGVGAQKVGKISFMVTLSSATANPIDLTPTGTIAAADVTYSATNSKTQISYSDKNVAIPSTTWTVSWVGANNGDDLLDKNEKAVVTVWLHKYDASGPTWSAGTNDGTHVTLATNKLDVYETFNLEVKPAQGAVLSISRTIPAVLASTIDLH